MARPKTKNDPKMEPLARRLSEVVFNPSELAEQLGVSSAAVAQYRNGSTQPTLANLVKIADIYGVSTDYLLARTNFPTLDKTDDSQAVCDFVGLSWSTVAKLHQWAGDKDKKTSRREVVDALVNNPAVLDALHAFFSVNVDCGAALAASDDGTLMPTDEFHKFIALCDSETDRVAMFPAKKIGVYALQQAVMDELTVTRERWQKLRKGGK